MRNTKFNQPESGVAVLKTPPQLNTGGHFPSIRLSRQSIHPFIIPLLRSPAGSMVLHPRWPENHFSRRIACSVIDFVIGVIWYCTSYGINLICAVNRKVDGVMGNFAGAKNTNYFGSWVTRSYQGFISCSSGILSLINTARGVDTG